jgi:hypothetical protein
MFLMTPSSKLASGPRELVVVADDRANHGVDDYTATDLTMLCIRALERGITMAAVANDRTRSVPMLATPA